MKWGEVVVVGGGGDRFRKGSGTERKLVLSGVARILVMAEMGYGRK